jgi:hypothetical protein
MQTYNYPVTNVHRLLFPEGQGGYGALIGNHGIWLRLSGVKKRVSIKPYNY